MRLDLQDAIHQITSLYKFDSGSLTDTDIKLADAVRELLFDKQWKEANIDNVFSGMTSPHPFDC